MPRDAQSTGRCLLLLRHGKAASDAPWGGGDRERPLTARGRRDAVALGHRLGSDPGRPEGEVLPLPDVAICSAAVRTRQTADLVIEAAGGGIPLDSFRSLYGAGPEVVLQYIREIDEGVGTALVVGHNPTMAQLASELIGGSDDRSVRDQAELESKGFPTCALAVLSLDVGAWEDVAPGCASLGGLFRPP